MQDIKSCDTILSLDNKSELFCENLAKMEYLKNRLNVNILRQYEYLYKQLVFSNNDTSTQNYTKDYALYDTNYTLKNEYDNYYKQIQKLPDNLKEYFTTQQEYYNQLNNIEQQKDLYILNTTKPNTQDLQQLNQNLQEATAKISEKEDKTLIKNTYYYM